MAQVDKQIDMKHDDTAQQLTFSPSEMGMIYEAVRYMYHARKIGYQTHCKNMKSLCAAELLYMGNQLLLLEHLIARMDDADWTDEDEDDEEHEALTDEQQIEIFGHITKNGIPD